MGKYGNKMATFQDTDARYRRTDLSYNSARNAIEIWERKDMKMQHTQQRKYNERTEQRTKIRSEISKNDQRIGKLQRRRRIRTNFTTWGIAHKQEHIKRKII